MYSNTHFLLKEQDLSDFFEDFPSEIKPFFTFEPYLMFFGKFWDFLNILMIFLKLTQLKKETLAKDFW